MKKSDIMLVIFIAAAGVVIAYFLCGAIMEDIKPVSFKTVGAISESLSEPDPEVFNSAALNPTVETYVGSCVDPDQNGELDLAESVLCQEAKPQGDGHGGGQSSGDNDQASDGSQSGNGTGQTGDGGGQSERLDDDNEDVQEVLDDIDDDRQNMNNNGQSRGEDGAAE